MVDSYYKEIGDPEDRVIEEAAEIIKAVAKGRRFVWDSCHPKRPNTSNRKGESNGTE